MNSEEKHTSKLSIHYEGTEVSETQLGRFFSSVESIAHSLSRITENVDCVIHGSQDSYSTRRENPLGITVNSKSLTQILETLKSVNVAIQSLKPKETGNDAE